MIPRNTIDLNCDLGESSLPVDVERDLALLRCVSSANIACGGHAGDERTMRLMMSAARQEGVAIGAHPSYPDRENFGRHNLNMPIGDLEKTLRDQLTALHAVADAVGTPASHVKPHGALYHDAAQSAAVAHALLSAIVECGVFTVVVGPPGAALLELAPRFHLNPIVEAFADRRYERDGRLRNRMSPGALLDNPNAAAAQALGIARGGHVRCEDGAALNIFAQSICVHSDTPRALEVAQSVRALLEFSGTSIRAPVHFVSD